MRISVRKKGLEPPRLAAPDPKSGAATNYATSALGFLLMSQIYKPKLYLASILLTFVVQGRE